MASPVTYPMILYRFHFYENLQKRTWGKPGGNISDYRCGFSLSKQRHLAYVFPPPYQMHSTRRFFSIQPRTKTHSRPKANSSAPLNASGSDNHTWRGAWNQSASASTIPTMPCNSTEGTHNSSKGAHIPPCSPLCSSWLHSLTPLTDAGRQPVAIKATNLLCPQVGEEGWTSDSMALHGLLDRTSPPYKDPNEGRLTGR